MPHQSTAGTNRAVAAGIVGRTVPLHAAEQTGAAMHAFDGRERVDVLARGDRHLVELVMAVAVEQAKQPVLAADADHLVLLAVDGRLEQRADLAQIGVVHVVGNELAVPQELAGLGVERDQRVRVEIGAWPKLAVEVRRGIADRQVDDAGLGVERERRPQAAAAMLERLCALPGVGAGLAGIGDEIELPHRLAGLELEGADPILGAEIGARRPGDDEVAVR